MLRYKLLLVDACIIIELFRLGIWEPFLEKCDVHISEEILSEALFFEDNNDGKHEINLGSYLPYLTVHQVSIDQLNTLKSKLGIALLERMDAGEAELLCVLENSVSDAYMICSADAVVYRYLGASYKTNCGLSLEEILTGIGLNRKLTRQFSKRFREQYSQQGFAEGITGQSFRPS